MKKIIIGLNLAIALNAGWYPEKYFINDMREHTQCQISEINCDWQANFSYQYYIFGITDVLIDTHNICLPPNVKGRQLFAIVTKYIEGNPKEWNKSPHVLVEDALIENFPCKK